MAEGTYTPTGTHLDAWLTAEEKRLIDGHKRQWEAANESGNAEGMAAAHAAAELVRAGSSNPYSGGGDGSEFIPLALPVDKNDRSGGYMDGHGNPGYEAATLPKAQSMEEYIKAIYAAQEDLVIEQMKSQYEQNVLELDSAAAKIPVEYTRARNSASGDNEIAKSAFNERAAARGLNSGTGTQAMLSMNNALLGSLATISSAEANALSQAELMRVQLQTAYSSNMAKAISENNLEKAAALYKELVRLDEEAFTRTLAQASENYRAYQTSAKI